MVKHLTVGHIGPVGRMELVGSPHRHGQRVPSGKLWPSGEFSVGTKVLRPDDDQRFRHVADSPSWTGLREATAESGASPRLDLSDASNSHNPPKKRGLKGITGYGRKMVKSFGALVNRDFPQHRVTFGTVTLPCLDTEGRRVLAESWSEILRQTLQWCNRRLSAKGLPPLVVSVTEIQPKRIAETGEGYLHLHLLWLNRPGKAGDWSIDPKDMRTFFTSLASRILGYPLPGHVNVDVKPVRGEAARYLAKYMSKGGEVLQAAITDWGQDACPATWWNMTGRARAWVKANTFAGQEIGHLLQTVLDWAWENGIEDVFAYLKHVDVVWDSVPVTMGYHGRVQPWILNDLTDMSGGVVAA